jgi:dipeptide/tripeptide permease
LFDTLVTTLLFTPLFSLIVGYFVLWEHFLAVAQQTAEQAGRDFEGVTGALIGEYFAHYWWLPVGTVAAAVLGLVLFRIRQNIRFSDSFLPVLLYNLTHQSERRPGMSFFDVGRAKFGEEAGDGPPAVLKIMVVFSMVSVFWALFDQHASTWIDQAKQMALGLTVPAYLGYWALLATLVLSLYAGLWLFMWLGGAPLPRSVTASVLAGVLLLGLLAGACDLAGVDSRWLAGASATGESGSMMSIQMDAAQLSAMNPLFVMIVIPALNFLVYAPLAKRGIEVKPLQKMTVGMFLAAGAFVAAAVTQQAIQQAGDGQVHALWQIVQYFVMTVSEVLVSITGLEFAYTQAPRAMKSTIMSFWLLCVTFGNLLVAFLAPLQKQMPLSQFFWLFAALMLAAAAIFSILAYLYKGKTYLQHQS